MFAWGWLGFVGGPREKVLGSIGFAETDGKSWNMSCWTVGESAVTSVRRPELRLGVSPWAALNMGERLRLP